IVSPVNVSPVIISVPSFSKGRIIIPYGTTFYSALYVFTTPVIINPITGSLIFISLVPVTVIIRISNVSVPISFPVVIISVSAIRFQNYHFVLTVYLGSRLDPFSFCKCLVVDPVSINIIRILVNTYQSHRNYNVIFSIFINKFVNLGIRRCSIRVVVGFNYTRVYFYIKINYSFSTFVH